MTKWAKEPWWEYKQVFISRGLGFETVPVATLGELPEVLTKLGVERWELVACTRLDVRGAVVYDCVLKRVWREVEAG